MAGGGESDEVRALYVGNLHPYVNEAMLQVTVLLHSFYNTCAVQ
jgi:hypothetical protein